MAEEAKERRKVEAESLPADDSTDKRNRDLLALFDAVRILDGTLCSLFESRTPGASEMLRLWAQERNVACNETTSPAGERYNAFQLLRVTFAMGHEIMVFGKDVE